MYAIHDQVQHRELVDGLRHVDYMHAHDKSLQKETHNGVEIALKTRGWKVKGRYYSDVEIARQAAERERAFFDFHKSYEYNVFLHMWEENFMSYKFTHKQLESACKEANNIISGHKLPLLAKGHVVANEYTLIITYIRP